MALLADICYLASITTGNRVRGWYPPFPHNQMQIRSANAFYHVRAMHCCMWWIPSVRSPWLWRVKVRQSAVISTV